MELDYPYSNHMVLQRNKRITISGISQGNEVNLMILDQNYTVPVNNQKWEVHLELDQPGGPYTMIIKDEFDTCVLDDILVGDVFLAAGQSNMELEMRESKEKKLPSYSKNVRVITVPKYIYPFQDDNKRWEPLTEESSSDFSAVAAFFSYYLEEDIPIGIISNNKGGTSASCWIKEEVLKDNPKLKSVYYDYYEGLPSLEKQKKKTEDYYQGFNKYQEELKEFVNNHPEMSLSQIKDIVGHTPWPPPKGYYDYRRPSTLYEHMFERTLACPIKAILWYQGEEDSPQYAVYGELLKTLIDSWREDYQEDLPFFIIQLPEYKNSHFDEIRRAQREVSRLLKNTYLVTTLKTGDPDYIHPAYKEEVGKRLAYSVDHYVYKRNKPITPVLDENTLTYNQEMKDHEVHLVIDDVDCIGHIKENRLILPVDHYHILCYANDDNPVVEIESKEGIPASPFKIEK